MTGPEDDRHWQDGDAYRRMADQAPVMLWVLDADGACTFVNRAWSQFTGLPPEQGLEFAWTAIVHPDDREHAADAFRARALAGDAFQVEYRLRTASGAYCWVVDHAVPVRRADGAVARYLGSTVDVDEHKRMQRSTADRQLQLDLALASAQMGSWRIDLAADTMCYDDGLAPLLGLEPGTREEPLSTHFDRVHVLDRARVRAALEDAIAGRREYAVEYRVQWPNGRVRWLAERAAVLHAPNGRAAALMGIARDVTAEKQTLADAQAGAERLRALSASSPVGIFTADTLGNVEYANPRLQQIWGATEEQMVGTGWTTNVHPDDLEALAVSWRRALTGAVEYEREYRIVRSDGETRWVHGRSAPLRDGFGVVVGAVGTIEDVTARHESARAIRESEEKLRQAQKMEAVGQLAGGIAHDFNNLLTVIVGSIEFVRHDLTHDHGALADLDEIAKAADRAHALVRQLLAFSRKQVLQTRAIDLNAIVAGAEQLLRRVIGEEITLETALAANPAVIRADPGQLEQVLVNLAVNARDAMLTAAHGHAGTGGTLRIETATVHLTGEEAGRWEPLTSGPCIELSVRDTGHGMDAQTRAHVFEPFFTTKGVGEGTGLGLATVYGIVAQSGGAIRLESDAGAGTRFTIRLPAIAQPHDPGDTDASSELPRGRETLLLVEDESTVRATARRVLERHGYRILEAGHGVEAHRVWQAHKAAIDAVVTDIRMPEMGGPELVALLRAERPTLPVVFVSGYAERAVAMGTEAPGVFIEKPFTRDSLLRAVHGVLRAAEPRE